MLLNDIPVRRRTSQTPPPDNESGRIRLILLSVGVIITFVVLGIRLFDLQVNRQQVFSARVEQRSIVERALPATRGLIYDRNGQALVRNAPAYQVAIIPIQQVRYPGDPIRQRIERMAMYNKLAAMINQPGVTAGDIYTKVISRDALIAPYQPTVIADNVPREVALAIQEQSLMMRGVIVQTVGSREYPYKELLGNILGYTGKILREMIERQPEKFPPDIYDYDNDRVGITGVERAVEEEVRGKKGKRTVLVDASFEELQVLSETPPVNGNSVRLTIDLRLQQIISDVLISAMRERGAARGAVVALNPNTGEILAMVSVPGYDNNLFARGISQKDYEALANDIHKPLLNHATQDRVPPGSTFKIVTAAALLQEGFVDERLVVFDPGIFTLPDQYDPNNPDKGQKFYCWKRTGHGFQNIRDALRNSCDTYFYKTVGGFVDERERIVGMGPDKLAQWAQEFGIGERTELNIDYSVGIAPTQNWKLRNIGEVWSTGDSYNASIGQGYVLATPLEMANVTAVIANGGTLYHPQIVREVINDRGEVIKPFTPKIMRRVRLDPYYIQLIQDTLWRVVNEQGGTAWTSRLEGFEYAGKTGTAEFCDDVAGKLGICYPGIKILPTHAWFVSYAPAQNPQIAMAVYVWNGGQGSGVAAPITQRIYNRYFDLGVPEDKLAPIQQGDSE
ncbi:MAG: penicillin-binding protein 2 [Anaerolineae bacterium]|nr:penicillin-binding protein 2 [Anaerolineae bacterium]